MSAVPPIGVPLIHLGFQAPLLLFLPTGYAFEQMDSMRVSELFDVDADYCSHIPDRRYDPTPAVHPLRHRHPRL